MSGDQPPLNVKSRGGAVIGFEPDVAELLARAMEVELRIVEVPFPKLMSALESGEIDIVMSGMAITSRRALGVMFVAPYVFSGKSILTKSESLAQAEDASDLNIEKIRLAALANSTSQSFVEGKLSQASLTTTQNYDEAIKLLNKQEVDAIVADMPICLFSVMRYPDQEFATLAAPLTLEPIGIAMLANDPQLENLLDNYMSVLERMGLLEKFRAKWFEDASWLPELP
jgi:polar amino acid transport system substrate-binding protein